MSTSNNGLIAAVILGAVVIVTSCIKSKPEASETASFNPSQTFRDGQPVAERKAAPVTEAEIASAAVAAEQFMREYRAKMPKAKPITAPEYWLAYSQNEIAADAQFKGKTLQVQGYVRAVQRLPDGSPLIALHGFVPGSQVAALLLPSQEQEASRLMQTQLAVLRCTGIGRQGSVPAMDSCVFDHGQFPTEGQPTAEDDKEVTEPAASAPEAPSASAAQ